MVSNKEVLKQELIGLSVKIIEAQNQSLKGLNGKIIDETKHTFVVLVNNNNKTIIKKGCVFQFKIKEKTFNVDGVLLEKRPEERIKIK
ncbi:ribonuclease P protein subunit [Candidatus Woesearchaeota archaeon]|jgi:RNase P/RNase MRP subunit p29|nr:ribonuclease P protein subunit [Candidatus Woesearchaeota archaeon]MBT5271922.1 ribonuclease P protein subunit [Candidatus Woesearchaeota archaeon]MBT6041034.1 ribonuclease P protein subunit [Candidatus Woesearchaeota archaeon]MBT6336210.1 ribonuclease P protein subunit [Candidatus Woesearchaeota archaeon]MBT7928023.1 ribonuclease P protein subunit [Candidatus Woesearchaeota archaeon]